MEKKRGVCLCDCGGDVISRNNTTIDVNGFIVIPCKRCGKSWCSDYAFSVRPFSGIIGLDIDDQFEYVRQTKKGYEI